MSISHVFISNINNIKQKAKYIKLEVRVSRCLPPHEHSWRRDSRGGVKRELFADISRARDYVYR